jgi:4-diphosphocytidyl-2-C-methyl-D-erythritol kinase
MDQTNHSIRTLTRRAYAKVNLALAVGRVSGVDGGGLHPICSWMHALELWDEIEIRRLCENQESIYALGWKQSEGEDKPVEWDQDSDLAVRAHKLIEAHVGRKLGVQIRVSKSIPAGGGLGGGSSDGAAVLMGLDELFRLRLDHAAIVGLAMELGSDVPFFLDPKRSIPRPAMVQGVGDQITRLKPNLQGTPITLILPGFGCPTGRVFHIFDEQVSPGHRCDSQRVAELIQQESIDEDALFNDLESASCCVDGRLGALKDAIGRAIGRSVHVSGSGSTLFVIGSIGPAESALIVESTPGCRVVGARLC